MVHAIQSTQCEKGHHLPISYDDNKCGCHHDGKPCIIMYCRECFKKWVEDDKKGIKYDMPKEIVIPLGEEGVEIIEKLIKN